jgi:CHRD domain
VAEQTRSRHFSAQPLGRANRRSPANEQVFKPTATAPRRSRSALTERPARVGASGSFTAQLRPIKNGYRLTWKLTFRGLSGRASTAYLHQGKPGTHGAALVHLCSLCKSGATGSSYFSPPELKLARAGRLYVNVRTAKNPSGEIRGQVRVGG